MAIIKLSYEIADKIRDEYYEPENDLKTLSKKYGVSESTISDIISFRSWSR